MGIRAGDGKQKVFVPKGVIGIDKPKVIVRVIDQCCAVILAGDFRLSRLNRLSARQVDVMHIVQVETFVPSENCRQFAAHFVVVKVCGEVLPVAYLFEKRRDFDGWYPGLLCNR